MADGVSFTEQQLANVLREMYVKAPQGERHIQALIFGVKYDHWLEGMDLVTILQLSSMPRSYGREVYKGRKLVKYIPKLAEEMASDG